MGACILALNGGANVLKRASPSERRPSVVEAGLIEAAAVAITSRVVDARPEIAANTSVVCARRRARLEAAAQIAQEEQSAVAGPCTPIGAP